MVRPPTRGNDGRAIVSVGPGTTLGGSGGPLMSDATVWGDVMWLSGRAAVDPATGRPCATTFDGQCRAVLQDVLAVLDAGGSGPEHVLRVECWLSDPVHFAEWNAHYAR